MATYFVTASNWNSVSFWSGIDQSAAGHVLDFSGLDANYTVDVDTTSGVITIAQGTTTYSISDSTTSSAGHDATLGGSTQLGFFSSQLGGSGADTLKGSSGDDALDGGAGDDMLVGHSGDDTITLGGGQDSASGGDGVDVVVGVDGDDLVNLGGGDESLSATGGNNSIIAGEGDDTISSDIGADMIDTGLGADSVLAGGGADTIDAGTGADFVDAGAGSDAVKGGSGRDTLLGGEGNDTIYGDDGDVGMDAGMLSAFDFAAPSSMGDTGNGAIGRFAVYDNIGTTDGGVTLQARLTIVDAEDPNIAIEFNDNSVFLNRDGESEAETAVTLKFEFFDQATGEPVRITGGFTFKDIDTRSESVSANSADVTGITLSSSPATHLTATDTGERLMAASDNTSSGNTDEDHWAQFSYDDQQELVFVVTSRGGGTNYSFEAGGFSGATTSIVTTPESQDDSIDGGTGDDLLFGVRGDDTLLGGDGRDTMNGGVGDDSIDGGADEDVITFEDGFGQDTVTGGEAVSSGADLDQIDFSGVSDNGVSVTMTGDEAGTATSAGDTVSFTDIETMSLSDNADTFAGSHGDDTVEGNAGDDSMSGGAGNDSLSGGADADTFTVTDGFGNDTVAGGETGTDDDHLDMSGITSSGVSVAMSGTEGGMATSGAHSVDFDEMERLTLTDQDDSFAGSAGNTTVAGLGGDDHFTLSDGFGQDSISGGETGETQGDHLDLSAVTEDVTVDLTAGDAASPESGTITSGANSVTFTEIENLTLGAGDDAVTGSSGDDSLSSGAGEDTLDGGAGDDHFDLGANDGARDVVVLRNGSNNDRITNFEAPTPNGDGTFEGNDQLDVSTLLAPSGDPVTTVDVNVADDGDGNALLLFHGGVTVTLVGITPADADNIYYLNAIGIPLPLNYIVEGDDGDNLIDETYLADPQGDRIDNNDHSDGSNDDVIEAGGGDDTVRAGLGNDSIEGQEGDDSIEGGVGNDTIHAGLDNDTVVGGEGNDLAYGSHGDDSLIGGDGSDSLYGEYGRDYVEGGDGDDTLEGNEGQDTLIGGAGNDWMRGSYDADYLRGGTGDDYLWGGFGDDTFHIENDFGNDTVAGEDVEETHGDLLDFSSVTDDLRFDLTNSYAKAGTVTDGTYTLQYNEVELIELGSGNDTLVLADSSGSDRVQGFRAPTDNGDGTYTGYDRLDVSDLNDDLGDPVDTADVTVSDTNGDGTGDAILTFPNGENITLAGVSVSQVQSPAQLVAIGIPPAATDFIVSGTANDDLIDGSYLDDPHGDRIDNADGVGGTQVDTVLAGAGDDTVLAGAAADSVEGGTGDDVLEGQAGADTLIGGEGADTLRGGADADSLLGGADADVIELDAGLAGDTVVGGETTTSGTDTDRLDTSAISTDVGVTYSGDEAGSVASGGDTASFSEIEALQLGAGNDSVDAATTTSGVTVDAGAGDDTLLGGAGDDTLLGGDDDDSLIGGEGADSLVGGAGSDRFDLGSGDTAEGEDGDDFFSIGPDDLDGTTITVTGGESGETAGDTLHITGPATIDMIGAESGTVTWMDGTKLNFSEIEQVHYTPCFTPGTLIKTLDGERDAADILPDDIVLTRDNGYQAVRWAGRKTLSHAELTATPALRPVKIAKGALGQGVPERDMVVSPQHRVVMSGYAIELLFGEDEVLVPATHLVGRPGITRICPDEGVTYVHFMFDHHELVMSDGAWTESFQPGDLSLAGLDQEQRDELLTLFPELAQEGGRKAYGAARMSLKSYQARLLADA